MASDRKWNVLRMAIAACALLAAATGAGAQEIVFNTQDFAPFSYLAGTEVAGPAADVIKAVCSAMGQPYRLALLPWTRAQQEVKEGKAQALFLVGWNADREAALWPSPAVLDTEYGFFVRTDNPLQFKSPDQLKGLTVAVYGPSNTATTLDKVKEKEPGITIDVSPDDEAAFRKLDSGRVAAAFSNRDVGLALVKKLGLKNVRYAGMQSKLKYFIGFSKTSVQKATVDKFNETYKKLYRSGEIPRILKGYGLEPSALE